MSQKYMSEMIQDVQNFSEFANLISGRVVLSTYYD